LAGTGVVVWPDAPGPGPPPCIRKPQRGHTS
jgi:hypothetical protein